MSMLLLTALVLAPVQQQPAYDLLITGGTVLDGTGAPGFRADVAVQGDRIVLVSRSAIPRARATRVIEAAGRAVSPGFIDLHAHNENIFSLPDAKSRVMQGVTTTLGGPDGGGPYPFGAYLERAEKEKLGINIGWLTGFGSIRQAVLGRSNRAPVAEELARMQRMVGEAMHEGAFGISTGLFYVPQTYAKTDEVIALSRVAADSGGFYTSHLRKEGLGALEGVGEAIQIARDAHIPVVLTHHKVIGRAMWGKSVLTLAMLDSARKAGLDVMADVYPYDASSTSFSVLVPAWAMADGDTAFARRVKDPVLRDSIVKGIIDILENDRGGGDLHRPQFASVSWKPDLNGRTLWDWAVERGVPTTSEGAAPLVIEGVLNGGASMVFHVMDEGDVQRILKHPWAAIASDGALSAPGASVPHPRNYGTFPRVLGRYVRELHVLTLPEALRKMTSLPAARMGLTDRGRIAEGMMADLVVFDPATVADKATYTRPHQYPVGIDYVVVNGQVEVDAGAFTAARAGRVLRHVPARGGATPAPQGTAAAPVAFVNVTVIPMDRERVLPDWTVVVQGGRIVAQGAAADVRVPAGATRVDGRGKYLIPGLAEMHAHIPPGNATDEDIARTLELWALNGVTTVRGMLGTPRHLVFRDRAARGEILSPRIVTSGPSFSGGSVPSPDSAVRMVLAEKALGYDFLKIHPGVSRAAFDSMAAAAGRAGIRFAGHVPLAVGLTRAISARYWTIDHLDGFIEAMALEAPTTPQQDGFFGLPLVDRLDESRLPGLVAAAKAAGIAIVPTELFFESVAGDEPVERLLERPDIRYVPEALVRGWSTSTNQIRSDNPRETRQKFIAVRRRILKALHDGGVPILLGSDSPQLWNAPGFSLAGELESYVAAGLSPWQALATGTRNVAVHLGNLDDAGTIQTGRRADLILLDGNPLADIRNVGRRAGVVVAGRWIPKAEIEPRLAALARP